MHSSLYAQLPVGCPLDSRAALRIAHGMNMNWTEEVFSSKTKPVIHLEHKTSHAPDHLYRVCELLNAGDNPVYLAFSAPRLPTKSSYDVRTSYPHRSSFTLQTSPWVTEQIKLSLSLGDWSSFRISRFKITFPPMIAINSFVTGILINAFQSVALTYSFNL
jgi:hypothetical protein